MSTTDEGEDLLDDIGEDGDSDDADLNDEGIFADKKDIFSSRDRPDERARHANPGPISREDEAAEMFHVEKGGESDNAPVITAVSPGATGYADAKVPSSVPAKVPKHQLVAKYDDDGRLRAVARFIDGKQAEKFRPPVKADIAALNENGRFVKGGIGVVDDIAPAQTATPAAAASSGPDWKKIAKWAAGLAVVGGIGYWIYKSNKADDDADVDEVD